MEPISIVVGFVLGTLLAFLLAFKRVSRYKREVAALEKSLVERTQEFERENGDIKQAYQLVRGALAMTSQESQLLKDENRLLVAQKLNRWGIPEKI